MKVLLFSLILFGASVSGAEVRWSIFSSNPDDPVGLLATRKLDEVKIQNGNVTIEFKATAKSFEFDEDVIRSSGFSVKEFIDLIKEHHTSDEYRLILSIQSKSKSMRSMLQSGHMQIDSINDVVIVRR